MFQRSPIWITPRIDGPFTPEQQRRFARVPFAARLHRWKIWWTYERANFAADSEQTTMQTELARSYLERKIADPELRAEAHARLSRSAASGRSSRASGSRR